MAEYFRGWKSTSSRNLYFQRFERKPPNLSPRKGGFFKAIRGLFSFLGRVIKWFFKTRGLWKKFILLLIFTGLLAFVFFGLVFAYYSFNLPDPNKLADRVVPESTKIFDRNGKLLYEIHGEVKRTLIPLDQIPKFARDATIAVEDKDFYKHSGIDLRGIARAIVINLLSGSARQGGSTITQQFVRNAVLSREKTFARKFKEIALSLQLERKYSKDEIFQLYLNEIPYGSNAYGIEAASQTFFGKSARDLNLTEAAYLAALPKAPTYYSPYGPHKEELISRARTILELMYEQGYITKQQRNAAQNQKVEFRDIGRGILAPHFVLFVQDVLVQKYGEISLQEGGLKVTTTLDLDLQKIAEEALSRQVEINDKKYNAHNASLVAIDPKTGQILAMVGSRDYFDKEHDGAVNVTLRPRQPGSSFKPYVYATAFQKGMSPATLLIDVVTDFGEYGGKEYIPQNYDEKEHGLVSIREAFQGSLNIPAVKTLILTGIEDSIRTAENLGITTLKDRSRFGPAIVLGGAEVKLLEHTAAYGVFATNGIKHNPIAILKIEDKQGNILEEYQPSQGKEVLNPQIAYQITNVLSDNEARAFIFGRNNRLTLPGRPVTAKTGTTQEYRDAWTIGYVPSLVAGVWVGNNDNAAMTGGASGSLTAANIWNEFMRRALEGKPVEEFVRPEGVVEMEVDSLSGKLPTAYSPYIKKEVFSSFNIPTEYDDIHFNGYNVLYAEKNDPLWESPVRTWAEAHGYVFISKDKQTEVDPTINLKITAPNKITSSPWHISAEAISEEQISEIQIFLDNNLLASQQGARLEYNGIIAHVDGRHQLTVQARDANNKINRKTFSLEFALGQNLVLLSPQDNQELVLPTNIVLETNQTADVSEIKFWLRSASGNQSGLGGRVTKQQVNQIYYYTLNWAQEQKPPAGSYAIFAQIGEKISNQAVIKIP